MIFELHIFVVSRTTLSLSNISLSLSLSVIGFEFNVKFFSCFLSAAETSTANRHKCHIKTPTTHHATLNGGNQKLHYS